MLDEASGLPYYYQTKTGATVWEKPEAFVIPLRVLQVRGASSDIPIPCLSARSEIPIPCPSARRTRLSRDASPSTIGTRSYFQMATVRHLPANLVTDVLALSRTTGMRTARLSSNPATLNTAVDPSLPREPVRPIRLITRHILAQVPVNRPSTSSAGRPPESDTTNPLSLRWRTSAVTLSRPSPGHHTIRTPRLHQVLLSAAFRMHPCRQRTKTRARAPRESHQNAKSRDRTTVWRAPARPIRPSPRSSCRTAPRSLRV